MQDVYHQQDLGSIGFRIAVQLLRGLWRTVGAPRPKNQRAFPDALPETGQPFARCSKVLAGVSKGFIEFDGV